MVTSIAKIEEKIQARDQFRERLIYLQNLQIHDDIMDDEYKIIEEEIDSIKEQLGNACAAKVFDASLDFFLDKFDLDPHQVEKSTVVYLIDKFIVQNEITMWAAKPSTGKSLLSVAVANIVLRNKNVKKVVYFDADNGLSTLQERDIDKLKLDHSLSFRYFHESKASKSEMWQIIKKLQKTDLSNILVIFDSIKNFIVGDRDKNKDVSKIMDVLKSLRKQGATVLFLHHTNKPQKDIDELTYAGSSAWEEDTSNAFILKRNEYKKTFIFTPIKKRVGDLQEIAFEYIADGHDLKKIDLISAKETEFDELVRIEIINFLQRSTFKPCYSQIMQEINDLGHTNKDKVNKVIQAGKGRYWRVTKLQENNKDIFELLEHDNIGRIGQISPVTAENVFNANVVLEG